MTPIRLLDRLEQGATLALFVWLCLRLWPQNWASVQGLSALLLVSEGLVVALLLIRRPTENISRRPRDWAIAAGGTFLAMAVGPGGAPIAAAPGFMLILVGIVVQIAAKVHLGRSFGLVAANRGVKSHSVYGIVRHPMYAGYMIAHVGFLLLAPSWTNLAIYGAVWALLVARINAEEAMLSADDAYRQFQARVRFRLAPGVY